jgi:predicted Zn-ribbon and HTH transcriptional regulator
MLAPMKMPSAVRLEECLRCGHLWTPKLEKPQMCPKCKSLYWDVAKRRYRSRENREKRRAAASSASAAH